MWDDRYSQPGYLFGTGPSQFLQARTNLLEPGFRVLAVADGEGRNSVFMAEQGCDVVAMDNSPVGMDKARRLAEDKGVTIDFRLADLRQWDWEPDHYDIAAAIFIQFADPAFRADIFRGLKKTVKPGGLVLLHGYTPKQIEYRTGGPPDPALLYTTDLLEAAFGDFEIVELTAYEADIREGAGHAGQSALIDLVARRPG